MCLPVTESRERMFYISVSLRKNYDFVQRSIGEHKINSTQSLSSKIWSGARIHALGE